MKFTRNWFGCSVTLGGVSQTNRESLGVAAADEAPGAVFAEAEVAFFGWVGRLLNDVSCESHQVWLAGMTGA